MPCRSDYLEGSGHELESRRVCRLIVYLFKKIHKNIPKWVQETADSYYGNINRLDEATKILCEACRSLTQKEQDAYIYDGHKKHARRLAGWWDRHQEWDKRRVKEEQAARAKATMRERALRKLTPEEMKALGLINELDEFWEGK